MLETLYSSHSFYLSFFFNDTATTEIYTLSLHDALPIPITYRWLSSLDRAHRWATDFCIRSEEHTSELQSRGHLVCRLLLEKKKDSGEDLYLYQILQQCRGTHVRQRRGQALEPACFALVDEQVVTLLLCLFFFNDAATTEIYTLSLHDALPI